jgi:hypothetical protein
MKSEQLWRQSRCNYLPNSRIAKKRNIVAAVPLALAPPLKSMGFRHALLAARIPSYIRSVTSTAPQIKVRSHASNWGARRKGY